MREKYVPIVPYSDIFVPSIATWYSPSEHFHLIIPNVAICDFLWCPSGHCVRRMIERKYESMILSVSAKNLNDFLRCTVAPKGFIRIQRYFKRHRTAGNMNRNGDTVKYSY